MPKPTFLIAVFSQPIGSFDKWISRGINALVSHEPDGGRVPKSAWEAAATAKNLYFMDYPSEDDASLQNEANQTHRLAFMQDDEPDLTRDVNNDPQNKFIKEGPFKGWTRPEVLVARYQRCKAAAPNLPVFCNFAGPQMTVEAYTHGAGHKPYIAVADWLSHDWYVKNKNHQRYPISLIGKAMDRLVQWSAIPENPAGKPQFVFIECSEQKVSPLGRAPTPDEVEEEVNLAVSKGARGIVYFPQRLGGGFQYDAMPPEIVERVTAVNRRLNERFNGGHPQPPPQPQPTEPDLLAAIQTLRADLTFRIDSLTQEITHLRNRRYRGTLDLEPIETAPKRA
jgi:hypothetical protein